MILSDISHVPHPACAPQDKCCSVLGWVWFGLVGFGLVWFRVFLFFFFNISFELHNGVRVCSRRPWNGVIMEKAGSLGLADLHPKVL